MGEPQPESQRAWARRPAWLLWAITLMIAAAGLALMVWDWPAPVPRGFFGIRGFAGVYAVGFGCIGALLTWRRPGHPVGWILDLDSVRGDLVGVVHRALEPAHLSVWISRSG